MFNSNSGQFIIQLDNFNGARMTYLYVLKTYVRVDDNDTEGVTFVHLFRNLSDLILDHKSIMRTIECDINLTSEQVGHEKLRLLVADAIKILAKGQRGKFSKWAS